MILLVIACGSVDGGDDEGRGGEVAGRPEAAGTDGGGGGGDVL